MRFSFLALWGLAALASLGWGQSSPTITIHPTGSSAYVGDSVTLTGAAEGTAPLALQWFRNNVPIAGATNASLTFSSLTLNDASVYYFTATNADGSATSLPTGIYVTKRPQTLALSPATTTAVAGGSIILAATSTSNLPVTLALISGSGSLNGSTLTGLGGPVVVRASQPGNDTYAAAEVLERTYTFTSGSLSPFITSPPPDQTVNAGTSVTFRAAAIGTPAPTYQWKKDNVVLDGSTNASLTLAAVSLADAGRYTVTATNPAGAASATVVLTVRAAPVFTTQPAGQDVFAGDRASFSVTTTGFPTPTYQWRRNGTAINGATAATLAFASAASTDAARYDVVATNALGSATSASATLAVTVRDFSGIYFGRFAGNVGEFALLVRADRSAVFLGFLPGVPTGLSTRALTLDPAGNFSLPTATLASAPQSVVLRGVVTTAGAVSGAIAELGATFSGGRVPATGSAAAVAGYYRAALIGSAASLGDLIVAADGQVILLSSTAGVVDGARGTLDGTGRLTSTTLSGAALDLRFSDSALTGTVRTPTGVTGTLAGAAESQLGAEHVVNLSVRTLTTPAAQLITGFVVSGTENKQVLIRAAGPTLAGAPFNVPNALADPTLQLFRGSQVVGQNDDWGTPQANVAALTAATTRAGAFPFRNGSADAALLVTLPPGPYSVVVGGGNGTTVAEVYEVLATGERPGTRRLVNVSARGIVTPGSPLIAGFVVTGPAPQRLLVRGIGPTLAQAPFNLAGVLPNPQLTVFRDASAVKANDDWFRDPEAALIRAAAAQVGAFALGQNSADAAVLLYLEPGAYTAQVSGPPNANQGNATGIALVEIYEAP